MNFYVTTYPRMAHRHMIENFMKNNGWNLGIESDLNFPVDVKVDADAFVITALLPGVKPEDLDIQVVDQAVTIQGQLHFERDEKDNYLLQERPSGKFSRELELGTALDPDGAEAHLENGVLTLRVAKAEIARPKTIKVVSK